MEAVPRIPLISFELKTSPENTQFGPKLKQYISEAYREDPDSYNNELHQLESLRSAAVRATSDKAGLCALTRYFSQLRAIQSRFPMAKGQPVSCNFSWKDLYANMTTTIADIRFEMACILYNIAVLHTQLGASEPQNSADSMKAACTHFQHAAWAFQYLREQYPQPTGFDVGTEIVRLLQEICFAQAQECILYKSIQDTRKPSVVGAVATQVLYFYKNSLALLGPSAGTDNIHEIIGTKLYNYWHRSLSFKSLYIGCIVCLYQGMNAEEQQKMGERVAFYQQAVDKLAEARKLVKYMEPVQVTQEAVQFTNDVVEGKRKAAKNENEFIYHEEVPDKDLLMDLKPVCLVKALAINFNDPEVSGPDIFSRLVPMVAHEAASLYSEEKAKLLRQVVGQVEAKNTEITQFMSSLQLDQLEVLDSDQKIPQEIVDRCAAMNAKVDTIQVLVDSMNNLAEEISDVEHALAEIKDLIQEESAKEKEYQSVMGPRPASLVQTELWREYQKYREAHARTHESNQVLHKAMTLHIANLRLLALPLDVLQTKIPSIENIEGLDRETMGELRQAVGKAREMQTQRDALVQQLREAITSDDITSQLLAGGNETTEDIFKRELEKHSQQVKIIELNLAAQENIINKLTSLYASYGESRRLLSDVLRKRESLVNALITSYDTYEELLGKSQKGLEFYKKLGINVNQLLARVRSACQVQEEERTQLLAKQNVKATPAPPVATVAKPAEVAPTVGSERSGPKLKDYLPFMNTRGLSRTMTPQAPVDPLPADTYYPESIYPTSVRPAPVGSEATDISQMQLPDGVVTPTMGNPQNTYNRYLQYGQNETDYSAHTDYAYANPAKSYNKPEEINYGYNTPYTPPQFSTQANPQTYSTPYYSGPVDNTTIVTDSQSSVPYNVNISQANMNPIVGQYNTYSDSYAHGSQMGTAGEPIQPMSSYNTNVQSELNMNFAQMQIGAPKSDKIEHNVNFGQDYSQTYYSVQYPIATTPNLTTYSNAGLNSNISMVSSQTPEYSSNYPYNTGTSQYAPSNTNDPNTLHSYNVSEPQYSYNIASSNVYDNSQGYAVYTNTDSSITYSTTNIATLPQASDALQYNTYSNDASNIDPVALAQLEAMDKPIKSHVTGEALTSSIPYQSYQNYDLNTVNYSNPEQNTQQNMNYPYQDQNVNYSQSYQNHPGYTFNSNTGNYDYNYGSQNSYNNMRYENDAQINADPQSTAKEGNWPAHGVYTSAGICETVQSPSEPAQMVPQVPAEQPNQIYYNFPYGGYQTNANQADELEPNTHSEATNYGANINQATYMHSGHDQNTNVTYSNNSQVSTPLENIAEAPNFDKVANNDPIAANVNPVHVAVKKEPIKASVENIPESKSEPSTFDLLSDIDFSVEQKPLMPEIKVPQISQSAFKNTLIMPKTEPVPKITLKEEIIERPAKKDVFSDPVLLNKFTQEVKDLQKFVDSLTNKTSSGFTILDSKWKALQDEQAKENMTRSKTAAIRHSEGSVVTDVVPFDDARLTLKSDLDAYINASYYKQLASWCIPLVISKTPAETEYSTFWRAMLENKIACTVCLLSEIEMQGNAYWPTAKGQSLELSGGLKVTLDEVNCTVHWTERKLTVTSGKTVQNITHYQINVFPAKIVCTPLVLLADRILVETYENKLSNQLLGACVQCERGAGRSAVLVLLIMVMCQVRAGQLNLYDVLDAGFLNLCKNRLNVLEDTKYLADAYRTVLFYIQGVLFSGSTSFNGEAVSVQMSTPVIPPVAPSVTPSTSSTSQKLQKFSRESFEEMKQSPGLKSGDMKDPLNFLDPLWSLKKK